MNHVTAQLQAYYDEEQDARTTRAVAAHLAVCDTCRTELKNLEMLSILLHEAPPAHHRMPADQFAAQVALQLPRKSTISLPERTLKWSWKLAPVLLVATWAFAQAAVILTISIEALLSLGIGGEALTSWIAERTTGHEVSGASSLLQALGITAGIQRLEPLATAAISTVILVVFTGLMALAVCSWVAVWWAAQES